MLLRVCGDSLDDVFCPQCTCESCGNGAHIGYNYPPKVMVVSNPEPCHNQNVDELSQTLTNFHLTCYSGDGDSFAHDSTPNFVNDSLNVFHPPPQTPTNSYEFYGNAWDRVSEIKNVVGNKQYKLKDVQELFRKLLNGVQNIHEEMAEYINISSWNCYAFSSPDNDDDENYTIAITPEEPNNSLSMRDEHLDTIPATKSDEAIKSSVEDLIQIPSEYEGIPDNMCDVLVHDNSSPLDVSEDQFEEFSDFNNDSTSIDDDYFSIDNIDYIELSPRDSKLVSLEEVKDDNLREKLMNINLLIAKIKSLNDNPTPDYVLKSPIPVEDSDSFLEKSNTSLSYSNKSLPEFETFSNHPEETNSGKKNSGNTTIYADISLPDLECFNFKRDPEPGELTSTVDFGIRENILSATNANLPLEDDHSSLFAYVVWIFLSFLTCISSEWNFYEIQCLSKPLE
uniref:Uncharacterized protein n=1 Tax=Tanacetum cinerariifolium TaxID=118510 RepID=A0A699HI34_TANCI|nr:hypothetical protein [Tanacetum cinerariifolium]